MRRDYTNKNKRFYDKSQYESKKKLKDKKLKLKTELLVYIFNNLNDFEPLINELLDLEKEYKDEINTKVSTIFHFSKKKVLEMHRFNMFYGENQFFSLYKLEEKVLNFFKNFHCNYFEELKINKEIYNVLSIFLEKKIFNRDIFIELLCKEMDGNFYLKKNYDKFDFEVFLELSIENKNILNIASKEYKEEILEILDCLE